MSPPVPRAGLLVVYLEGKRVGTLEDRTLGYVAFRFDPQIVERYGRGARLLSVGIPVQAGTVDPLEATPFFAGLLPEGDALVRLAGEFKLDPTDTYGLLTVLGRECAGALVIVAEDARPHGEGTVRWLEESELAYALRVLADAPLGVRVDDESVRLSLAGAQDKLPVVIDGERVGIPIDGHPSTSILKPASTSLGRDGELRFPDLVANEAFSLAMAAQLGLSVAAFSVLTVEGEPVLAVERFDRRRLDSGRIVRIHQEDLCQALRIRPEHKYEAGGGPTLARAAALLDEVSAQPLIDRRSLLRLAVFNALIGNADAHGKNISLLHEDAGVRLAPAYDLVATQISTHSDVLGMFLGEAKRLRELDRAALIAAGASCGFATGASEALLDELLDGLDASIEAAAGRAHRELWWSDRLELLIEGTRARAARLRKESAG